MKLSYNWLKNYIAVNVNAETLAHKLTMAGLEVKAIDTVDSDSVFEIEITPNRPDCLSVLGIAREASAIFNKPLKIPAVKNLKLPKQKCDLAILDKKDCLRYIGCLINNVSVRQSPEWIKKPLTAVELRTINNVVDITNFGLMETGQPMHAFDFDKLAGGKIIVRRAKEGEKIITIDGIERKLDPSILVIADEKKTVAIAGIMGGKETEVTESTKNILLESAYFEPILIRRAGRKLGLSTDASYRFERGVDMEGVEQGARRATALICQEAGGSIQGYFDLYPGKRKDVKRQTSITKNQIDEFLGAPISLERGKAILNRLGFKTANGAKGALKISIPPFRNDVKGDVDIIEEIARVVGYDNLPVTLPEVKFSNVAVNPNRILRKRVTDSLLALGLNEAVSYSMTSRKNIEAAKLDSALAVKVKNPLTLEQECLRFSMLPSLLELISINLNRGQRDIKFFEAGKTYFTDGEKETLGIIMSGHLSVDWRKGIKAEADFYDIKGVIENTLEKIGVTPVEWVPNKSPVFEPGQGAEIILNGEAVGALGAIAAEILHRWDIKQKGILFAELDLETIYAQAAKKTAGRKYCPLPTFPAVVRDLSLAIKSEVSFQQVRETIQKTAGDLLASVKLIEQYLGEKIPPGQRGLVLSLTYQSSARTLREDEVNQAHEKICKALIDTFGAVRR
ncbi:MAG TPA: phenylalanine--tRNA ligase subunit beta [Candidatus Omnitrophota bacterium]|nr:phenylalanine--tRNA ligase subunit beta [Candidatus Omnitrophota bacterium]HPD84566.1 phenylalanine--tRNA ligase subunit beta [Candidatus Omnitrophota bacterium]HRZ03424.1 phenylalanine--tRNA ligase subunit beta [Candidatus Omnitrophota bacterium]